MAGACDKINSLVAQEFSFVQELVWLPPRRNPFPRCTDKIVSSFRKLEVLYRRPANASVRAVTGGRNNYKSSWRAADHALSILMEDADELIRLRRSLCKQLLSVQASSSLNEFEHQAEALIMQYLENGWGSCKHGSVEMWASKVKGLDFQILDMTLEQLFVSWFSYAINQRGDHADQAHNSDTFSCEKKLGHKNDEIESVSTATSLHDGEEEDVDELSGMDSIEGDPAGQNQGLPLVLITDNEAKYESKPNISNIESRGNLPIQMEMTMKARICTEHITAPDQYCWHIIFGIVNHDHCEVAVHSLTYWSMDNESEVSTIKWPKGGVILKEAPSLLCYSCQMHCRGPCDSPRVAFNWHFRGLQKYPVLRKGSNEEIKERPIEPLSLELQNSSVVGIKQASKDPLLITGSSNSVEAQLDVSSPSLTVCQVSDDPFYKRLGNFLTWKDSCKKARKSAE